MKREVIRRHRLSVRITHWINALLIALLLMSGLNIFNAHPHLYWGQKGADFDRPWLELTVANEAGRMIGVTRLGGAQLDTTGVLGLSQVGGGHWAVQGFPNWATFPGHRDLATARRWLFFLAWLLVANAAGYWLFGLADGHIRRDIAPTGKDLAPKNLWRSIVDHVRLKHPTGEAAKSYNVLQKLAYVAVIVVFLPAMVLTGLCMSPGFDAAFPWLVDVFGGRQSARGIHFISASAIVLFVAVHVIEVFLAGPINEIRSMITGRYVVPQETHK